MAVPFTMGCTWTRSGTPQCPATEYMTLCPNLSQSCSFSHDVRAARSTVRKAWDSSLCVSMFYNVVGVDCWDRFQCFFRSIVCLLCIYLLAFFALCSYRAHHKYSPTNNPKVWRCTLRDAMGGGWSAEPRPSLADPRALCNWAGGENRAVRADMPTSRF